MRTIDVVDGLEVKCIECSGSTYKHQYLEAIYFCKACDITYMVNTVPIPKVLAGANKDTINPNHYRTHPSGVECIQITEHMGFCLGNAIKYIWRADLKHDDGGIEDIRKAQWYIERELTKRQYT